MKNQEILSKADDSINSLDIEKYPKKHFENRSDSISIPSTLGDVLWAIFLYLT